MVDGVVYGLRFSFFSFVILLESFCGSAFVRDVLVLFTLFWVLHKVGKMQERGGRGEKCLLNIYTAICNLGFGILRCRPH